MTVNQLEIQAAETANAQVREADRKATLAQAAYAKGPEAFQEFWEAEGAKAEQSIESLYNANREPNDGTEGPQPNGGNPESGSNDGGAPVDATENSRD